MVSWKNNERVAVYGIQVDKISKYTIFVTNLIVCLLPTIMQSAVNYIFRPYVRVA
jgi:hypothetical protein